MTLQAWSQCTEQMGYTQNSHIPMHTCRQSPCATQAAVRQGFSFDSKEISPLCTEVWSRDAWASSRASKSTTPWGNTASALKLLAETCQVQVFHMQGWGTTPSLRHMAIVQHRDGLSAGRRKRSPLESTACREQTVLLKHASGQHLQYYHQDHAFLLFNSVCL